MILNGRLICSSETAYKKQQHGASWCPGYRPSVGRGSKHASIVSTCPFAVLLSTGDLRPGSHLSPSSTQPPVRLGKKQTFCRAKSFRNSETRNLPRQTTGPHIQIPYSVYKKSGRLSPMAWISWLVLPSTQWSRSPAIRFLFSCRSRNIINRLPPKMHTAWYAMMVPWPS